MKVGERLCAASESHLLAEIIPALSADTALTTGDADLESYPVSNLEARDLRPERDDNTGRLMAQRKGHAGTEVAIGKFLVVRYI